MQLDLSDLILTTNLKHANLSPGRRTLACTLATNTHTHTHTCKEDTAPDSWPRRCAASASASRARASVCASRPSAIDSKRCASSACMCQGYKCLKVANV
jgi:hypothetical protein